MLLEFVRLRRLLLKLQVRAKAKALFAEGGMLLCSLRLARLGYGVVEAEG